MNINLSAGSWPHVCGQNTHALFIYIFWGCCCCAIFNFSSWNLVNLVESDVNPWRQVQYLHIHSLVTLLGNLCYHWIPDKVVAKCSKYQLLWHHGATFAYCCCLPYSEAGFELHHNCFSQVSCCCSEYLNTWVMKPFFPQVRLRVWHYNVLLHLINWSVCVLVKYLESICGLYILFRPVAEITA